MKNKTLSRRTISPSVTRSPAKTVGGPNYEGSGKVTVQGKTKVTNGPAAGGPCKVPGISKRRMGSKGSY
jgi:hypothetical protein